MRTQKLIQYLIYYSVQHDWEHIPSTSSQNWIYVGCYMYRIIRSQQHNRHVRYKYMRTSWTITYFFEDTFKTVILVLELTCICLSERAESLMFDFDIVNEECHIQGWRRFVVVRKAEAFGFHNKATMIIVIHKTIILLRFEWNLRQL